jgi:hypothetical protein
LSSDLRYSFTVGAFACPLIFEYDFLLHHRVTAEVGLNIINGVMQPFAILNRPGMFVSTQKEPSGKSYIYYMHFIGLPVDSNSGQKCENSVISLRIYGFESLSRQGFMELVNMIHSKLDISVINLLGTWISRYGSSKLVKEDFEILLPVDKAPAQKIIHECDMDPLAFLTLIPRKFIGCFHSLVKTPIEIIDKYIALKFPGINEKIR